jgi:hypothetical protein
MKGGETMHENVHHERHARRGHWEHPGGHGIHERRAGDDERERRHHHGFGHGHGGGRRRGRGFGRPGGWQQADLPPADGAEAWLRGRLPDGWFTAAPTVTVDREEITVVGELPPPETDESDAAAGRISRFREETREQRMQIADEAEARYGRKVAWGASIGDTRVLFTHLSVPVMTRLRQNERRVLDTLVDAGVARSRSEALAWCVRLVGEHTDEWLASLRAAMSEVDKLRAEGPDLGDIADDDVEG